MSQRLSKSPTVNRNSTLKMNNKLNLCLFSDESERAKESEREKALRKSPQKYAI